MARILISLLFVLSRCECVQATNPAEWKTFNTFNKLQIEYTVLLPKEFDPNKTYPAVLSFSTYRYNKEKTLSMANEFWNEATMEDYIVIVPTSPKDQNRGWISHPAHHGLLDFLKMINKTYRIENDKFHILGFEEGCIPAQTYVTKDLFVSLTTVSSEEWGRFDSDWYEKMSKHQMPTLIIYGIEDESGVSIGKQAKFELSKRGVVSQLILDEGDRYTLPSAHGNQVLKHLSDFVNR
ncbi:hypothetical protein [Reichenbachiella sp.]|uniref:hypothetical protein n=1 Tax=Reichenbachiella sp. TaxID=2184521 RepID=UPI003BAF5199